MVIVKRSSVVTIADLDYADDDVTSVELLGILMMALEAINEGLLSQDQSQIIVFSHVSWRSARACDNE